MAHETEIRAAYETGLARFAARSYGGSVEGTFFVLASALLSVRGYRKRPDPMPSYDDLSPGERKGIEILWRVATKTGDPIDDFPQYIEPISIVECGLLNLRDRVAVPDPETGVFSDRDLRVLGSLGTFGADIIAGVVANGVSEPVERTAPILIEPAASARPCESWIGGAPRLGGGKWPRGRFGRRMRFTAQLDCGEIAAACPGASLPGSGALVFFHDGGARGAVLHLAENQATDGAEDDARRPVSFRRSGTVDGEGVPRRMFGQPGSLQDNAMLTNAHRHLLLQDTDGHSGLLQFWIAPEDLRAAAWDRVVVTFEQD